MQNQCRRLEAAGLSVLSLKIASTLGATYDRRLAEEATAMKIGDVSRPRRFTDPARRRWYAYHRALRFANRMGFGFGRGHLEFLPLNPSRRALPASSLAR